MPDPEETRSVAGEDADPVERPARHLISRGVSWPWAGSTRHLGAIALIVA